MNEQGALLLLDDEIIALSIRAEADWPTSTPSVDLSREEEIRGATERGLRSLIMRGLLDITNGERLDANLDALASGVLGGRPRLALFVGTGDFHPDPRFSRTVFHENGAQSYAEVIGPTGIHYVSGLAEGDVPSRVAELLNQAADGAFDQQLDGTIGEQRRWLWAVPHPSFRSAMAVRAGAGAINAMKVATAGTVTVGGELGGGSEAARVLIAATTPDHQ